MVLQITTKHLSSFWKRQIASLCKAGSEKGKVMESRLFQYEGEESIGEFTTLERTSVISIVDGGWGRILKMWRGLQEGAKFCLKKGA